MAYLKNADLHLFYNINCCSIYAAGPTSNLITFVHKDS